jgi:hypothetical protein
MHSIRRYRRLLLATVAATTILSLTVAASGPASAKAARGTVKWCAKHPKKCPAGGSGTGAPGSPPAITIQVDANPMVETSSSAVAVIIQIEANPAFAGDQVVMSSSQFDASCALDVAFSAAPVVATGGAVFGTPLIAPLVLDDDGNATVSLVGTDCAPGSDVIEASLAVAPFVTALADLIVSPPAVTPPGLSFVPTHSGPVAGEVETGDTAASGDSDIAAVFTVETDPVYAEQTVEIGWNQLESRCLASEGFGVTPPNGIILQVTSPGGIITPPISEPIDDDGNATFLFFGSSCAAGSSEVIADVLAGTHPTYATTFTIAPPQVT